MLFLRRFLPVVVGLLAFGAYGWQAQSPRSYPWLAVAAVALFTGAALSMAWKRVPLPLFLARMGVSFLLLLSLGYALLLAEGVWAQWGIPVLAGVASFAALELLFLHVFLPQRYPVNGLSHLNLALVPLVLWCVQSGNVGLAMFIHAPQWIGLCLIGFVCGVLFWATAHAESRTAHQRRWTFLGALIGVHLGLLGALLPLPIPAHGAYAAVLGAVGLRARRYGIAPRVPRRMVLVELAVALVLMVTLFSTGQWA